MAIKLLRVVLLSVCAGGHRRREVLLCADGFFSFFWGGGCFASSVPSSHRRTKLVHVFFLKRRNACFLRKSLGGELDPLRLLEIPKTSLKVNRLRSSIRSCQRKSHYSPKTPFKHVERHVVDAHFWTHTFAYCLLQKEEQNERCWVH